MLRIMVGSADLAASRFGISPVGELEHLLRYLGGRVSRRRLPPAALTPFARRYRQIRHRPEIRMLHALQHTEYGPNFVTPPPNGLAQTLADDLATVRMTPLDLARTELQTAIGDRPLDPDTAAALASENVTTRVADALTHAWQWLIAADWPLLRAILERDILHRAEQLTRAGWHAALADLHPAVTWRNDTIRIAGRADQQLTLTGQGILLVPSVFIGFGFATYLDPPWQPALVYPARGAAALWEPTSPAPDALTQLLGAGRARLLLELAEPATTTQLTATTGTSFGTIGGHLKILRDAGLITRNRAGRSVIYTLTPLGQALIAGAGRAEPSAP